MDKIEISDNCFVDFLPILYQKVKNYFWLSKKHQLATIDVMKLNVTALKASLEIFFGHYSIIQITV